MNEYGYNDWRSYLMHYNHNHDALGRFTSASGYSAIALSAARASSKYERKKTKADKTYKKLVKAKKRGNEKKTEKLNKRYTKQTLKVNKAYKKQVETQQKADKFLKQKFKEEQDEMRRLGYKYNKRTGKYETEVYNGVKSVVDPVNKQNEITLYDKPLPSTEKELFDQIEQVNRRGDSMYPTSLKGTRVSNVEYKHSKKKRS